MKLENCRLTAVVAIVGALCAPSTAEILNIRQMELNGLATVTASRWDIGHKDHLFDQNWDSLYRTAAINPAIVTVEFVNPQISGAARAKFSVDTHEWTLEAADSLADLDNQTGTYIHIFGPARVSGTGIHWQEWNRTPVTRLFYRYTVQRITGDDYVHIYELELQTPEPETTVNIGGQDVRINIIEVDPQETQLPLGRTLQYYAEASLCYGPNRYDVTDIAAWSADVPAVVSISATGLATAIGVGATGVHADIGVVRGDAQLSVREVRPADLNVGFIHRTPEYNRFMVSFDGDQHIMPGYENEQKWPGSGELVTYTAHIFNKGDTNALNVRYRWVFDDVVVNQGNIGSLPAGAAMTLTWASPWPADTVQTVSIPPGAMTLHHKQLERAIGDHRLRLELDPDDLIPEISELNNAVEDYINALTFWLYMNESTYERFSSNKNFLETYSPEDWAQMQLVGLQRRLWVSGVPQRIRLDMLAVVPDGELNPGGVHEPFGTTTRQADGRWGFSWPEWYVERYVKIVENALMHEWGHQIGIIDVYQYDIATGNCLVRHNGTPVAGTALMPTVSPWNVYYGNFQIMHAYGQAWVDATDRGLMADPAQRYLGAGSAAGMNRNLGLRRGFFGDYLGAVQQGDIKLKVQHQNGAPVANCDIRVLPRDLSSRVEDNPKFVGLTDAAGEWTFPAQAEPGWQGGMAVNNPWSFQDRGFTFNAPDPVGRNAPMIVELEFGGIVEYHFIEVDELNVAMAAGVVTDYTILLTTYDSRKDDRLPDISFNGAPQDVFIQEDETFEATISAVDPDGDPVTLGATPLYNSSFNPATGRFVFRPDSLQVNRLGAHTEWLVVTFTADDGKFTAVRRMNFYISDIDDFAVIHEGAPAQCPADLNNDGVVDLADLGILLADFGCTAGPGACPGDIDNDGDTDLADLGILLAAFGSTCP